MRINLIFKLEPVTITSLTYMRINKVPYEECKRNNDESGLLQRKPRGRR